MSLQDILAKHIEDVLLPNASVNKDALDCLKQALDPVAGKYTALGTIHVDGLKSDQVWVQAQMILEGITEKVGEKIAQFGGADGEADHLESDLSNSEDSNVSNEDLSGELSGEISDGELINEESSDQDEPMADADSHLNDEEVEVEDEEEAEAEAEEEAGDKKEDFDLAEFQQHVLQLEQDGDDDDEEEIDFNADIDGSSEDEDMHYADFFAPSKKSKHTTKPIKQVVDENEMEEEDQQDDEEGNDVLETTRRDLFDSEVDEEGNHEQVQPGELSKFEKQQQELARQIEELENENIGKKEWGMKGEAQAKDRPEESLFNIQFERNAKAAPVITEEATISIEDMIKERIKKQQFDDIPRRSESAMTAAKKELPELSTQKNQQSLAELYEEDRMRAENPDYFTKQDAAVMSAAHKEIVDLFTSVSRKLDALCSWQYTPRAPTPSLSVVSDTPSIAMEEAQPGTMSAESQLAPQEIYKSESAVPLANQEMTTSMKRKRRRDKAKSKTSGKPGSTGKKEEMFTTLKRGNVTMVDKRGQKRDMQGNAVKEGVRTSASNIKL